MAAEDGRRAETGLLLVFAAIDDLRHRNYLSADRRLRMAQVYLSSPRDVLARAVPRAGERVSVPALDPYLKSLGDQDREERYVCKDPHELRYYFQSLMALWSTPELEEIIRQVPRIRRLFAAEVLFFLRSNWALECPYDGARFGSFLNAMFYLVKDDSGFSNKEELFQVLAHYWLADPYFAGTDFLLERAESIFKEHGKLLEMHRARMRRSDERVRGGTLGSRAAETLESSVAFFAEQGLLGDQAMALAVTADVLELRGDGDRAKRVRREAADVFSTVDDSEFDDPKARIFTGVGEDDLHSGNVESAVFNFVQAGRLSRASVTVRSFALRRAGNLLEDQGHLSTAVALYRELVAVHLPDYAHAWVPSYLGDTLRSLGLADETIESMLETSPAYQLAISPEAVDALSLLGAGLTKQGQALEAVFYSSTSYRIRLALKPRTGLQALWGPVQEHEFAAEDGLLFGGLEAAPTDQELSTRSTNLGEEFDLYWLGIQRDVLGRDIFTPHLEKIVLHQGGEGRFSEALQPVGS